SVLLKYPVSWPPTGGPRVTQVDGAGGWGGLKCVHDLVHSGCWDTHPEGAAAPVEGAMPQEWMTRDADNLDEEGAARIVPADAASWPGLPDGFEPAFAGTLPLRARNGGAATVHVLAGRLGGEDRVLIAGGARPLAIRDWSDWIEL